MRTEMKTAYEVRKTNSRWRELIGTYLNREDAVQEELRHLHGTMEMTEINVIEIDGTYYKLTPVKELK